MPPKRRTPGASTSKAPPTSKPRQSALAKEHSIPASTESEILEAFSLFSQPFPSEKHGLLPTKDLRRALIAFGTPPSSASELQDLIEAADPDETGLVRYEEFVGIAALKWHARSEESQVEEIDEAFQLFLGRKGKGREGEVRITVGDLKRIARELKLENEVGEAALRDMINEANGEEGAGKGVGRGEFEGVMRRAGVFS
ncbi:hypothetical protein MMC30_006192 [Trapelia coarctata]|nr:hypothetical protein [Trapelia coarctata]